MEDGTPKTHPSWCQGAKNTFFSTFQHILFAPKNHLATPWQCPGTTQGPLVTTWHHQIAWGITWEPYEAKTLSKTAVFFQCETSKIQISRPFLARTLTDLAGSGDKRS